MASMYPGGMGPVPAGTSWGQMPSTPGTAPVDQACGVIHAVAQSIAPEEAVLRLLESAVAQLYAVVAELRQVADGTRQCRDGVGQLLMIDWRSPAGEAFTVRAAQMRQRADELTQVAEELAVTSQVAIGELRQRIDQTRQNIAMAKSAAVSLVSGGVC